MIGWTVLLRWLGSECREHNRASRAIVVCLAVSLSEIAGRAHVHTTSPEKITPSGHIPSRIGSCLSYCAPLRAVCA